MSQYLLISIIVGVIIGLSLFVVLSLLLRKKSSQPLTELSYSQKEAANLLRRAGYKILKTQQKETVITIADGKEHFGYVVADFLVEKLKRQQPVLVFSGEGSPDPNEPNLRRRLLEYDRAFSAKETLILNMNKGEIHSIGFRFPHERNIDFFFRFLTGLFIILIVVGIIWVLAYLKLF